MRGKATLIDASALVPDLRATKSAAEIAFVREAARLSDLADRAAIARPAPGADEGEILAAMHSEIFAGGGDYPGNEFIIGSGADALLCRYKSGSAQAGRRRPAHARIRRRLPPLSRRDHAHACRRAAKAAASRLSRGGARTLCWPARRNCGRAGPRATFFRPMRGALDAQRPFAPSAQRLRLCGLGAKFTPSWMDAPMFYEGNDFVDRANRRSISCT